MNPHTLIVVTGPTGVGKTAAAIALAQRLGCDIINADSRQIYRQLPIGTAAPSREEQALVRHHFVGFKDVAEAYSAAQFESDVLALLPSLWQQSSRVVMCGGSMLYIDAVCRGIDQMPDIAPAIRQAVKEKLRDEGLAALQEELREIDPAYWSQVDLKNPSRVQHAVEVCRQTGVPFSTLRTGCAKPRPFDIVKVCLNVEREQLFDRINHRVLRMMDEGLEAEAQAMYPLRHLNALNTVGYKEMFAYFDGLMDRETAIARIQKNTRVYAKKQLTWHKKDDTMNWCRPEDLLATVDNLLSLRVMESAAEPPAP